MSVLTKKVGNKEVIIVDCSGMNGQQSKEIMSILKKASSIVASKPKNSVHIISNVTNIKFNTDISNAYKEYATSNTPYVRKSVVVGLSGMQSIIFSAIKKMTGRNFELANTMKEAENYMLADHILDSSKITA